MNIFDVWKEHLVNCLLTWEFALGWESAYGYLVSAPSQTLDRQTLDKINPREANTRHDKP